MKKAFFVIFLFVISSINYAQNIQNIIAYTKLTDARIVSLLDDNTLWSSNGPDKWEKIDALGLPANSKIKLLGSYFKINLDGDNSILVAVLEDNSIWALPGWKNSWEKIDTKSITSSQEIVAIKPYVKYTGIYQILSRFVVVLKDNSMFWFDGEKNWEKIDSEGLPNQNSISFINSYQKLGMLETQTRYIVTLSDNSIWWYAVDNKKWLKFETNGLPEGKKFKNFDAYMKFNLFTTEGRLICVLDDNTIWWMAVSSKTWQQLDTALLPKLTNIKSLKVYQKFDLEGTGTRVILLLEDNSIWAWTNEEKKWIQIPPTGLPTLK